MPLTPWTRRTFLGAVSAAAATPKSFSQSGDLINIGPASRRVLLGTQGKVSKGIYTASFNPANGALGPITLAAEVASPTFLALHQTGLRQIVYAVSEVDGPGASVSAFAVVHGGETLTPLNRQPTGGDTPTHLSLTPDGRALAVANYGGGSITTFRIAPDGTLSAPVSHIQYTGSGPDANRQTSPHAHSAQFTPDGHWLLVNDLGLDRINVYRLDSATASITPAAPPFWSATPGAGPRHITFHPNGRWIYSVNEMGNTVDQLGWDAATGHLTPLSHTSTLPPDFPPHKADAGEILCSPDGHHLYVGNRIAAETVAVFDIHPTTGALTLQPARPQRRPKHPPPQPRPHRPLDDSRQPGQQHPRHPRTQPHHRRTLLPPPHLSAGHRHVHPLPPLRPLPRRLCEARCVSPTACSFAGVEPRMT